MNQGSLSLIKMDGDEDTLNDQNINGITINTVC